MGRGGGEEKASGHVQQGRFSLSTHVYIEVHAKGYIEVHANAIHLIYIGVYPHKYIGHDDNVQTGGVLRVRLYVI